MKHRRQRFIALLRGVNVSGQHKLPMVKLRSMCTRIDLEDVRTYIQSGNIVFTSAAPAAKLEQRLEEAIEQEFRFFVPAIVRSASRWKGYVEGMPFPDEAMREGNWVLLAMSKRRPTESAASELQNRAKHGERVVERGDAIWIHYAKGIGRSKLTPTVLDRCIGSPVTGRNWRTVLKLQEMVRHD
jgi:uncharacterized protein (DUF1697 family)